jgi:hypothetical protein
MKTPKKDSQSMAIALDPNPKGEFKRSVSPADQVPVKTSHSTMRWHSGLS